MRSHRVREAEHFLANPGPYCSTTHLDSPLKNVTNNDGLPTQGYPVPQAPIKTYGMSRRKKHMNESDLLALIVLVVCFVASIVTISPQMMFAWRLGLKRQFQIIGFLLSIMNLCLNAIAPKIFLMSEARFGHSYIQNFDAILRNSVVLSHTGLLWRVVLLAMIALPSGLSIAYKEFIEGSHNYTLKDTGGYYGLAGPGQLSKLAGNAGLSLMINATLPFVEASANDDVPPDLSSLPQAYGFNMLLLSENSTAFLDGPMPDYVSSIQATLAEGESQSISAWVHATISIYNDTAESFRNDSSWWKQYINFDPGVGIAEVDLYINMSIGLLVANFDARSPDDKSWCFVGIVRSGQHGPTIYDTFQYSALEFNTRRDICQGTWTVTRNRVELASGHCNPFSLSDSNQKIITNNSLGFVEYYMPTLSEFLGPFAKKRNTSEWLLPTFTTTVAAMYWSRMSILNGYYSWGWEDNLLKPDDPYHAQKSQVYYHVPDTIVSTRITMDPSWVLYLVLAIQPVFATLFFLTALTFYQTPLDGGFGIVAVLAGVTEESLKLLRGASLSGRLSEPVKMQITVTKPIAEEALPEVKYIFAGSANNETLGHTPRYPMLRVGNWLRGVFKRVLGRERNQYEMF